MADANSEDDEFQAEDEDEFLSDEGKPKKKKRNATQKTKKS